MHGPKFFFSFLKSPACIHLLLQGPLEESYFGKTSDVNPGLLLVERLYNYVKCNHPKTLIMASGIRTKEGGWRAFSGTQPLIECTSAGVTFPLAAQQAFAGITNPLS